MSTSNKLFLAAVVLNIVAITYMPPPFRFDSETTGEVVLNHVETVGLDFYPSFSLVLFLFSIGLFIAGFRLRKR
jgi:hypothetical protein